MESQHLANRIGFPTRLRWSFCWSSVGVLGRPSISSPPRSPSHCAEGYRVYSSQCYKSDVERPPNVVVAAGALWYGSLVVTLIGALWGVLAKGWLGEILRETPNNPADRALERWRRDKAARLWYMDSVITGVPLLIQVGLAMFLTGFVVQSFDDYRAIGFEVLVYFVLGAFAYALFTFLPWFRPDCPYRTPLTNFFHLVNPDLAPTDWERTTTMRIPNLR
ncbi:hypothetical protein BJ912DRAFT_373720 [Pholiota molesta]|nr:hypothetical protein BJ912DRAFT_373720 [Pholiota molesta]